MFRFIINNPTFFPPQARPFSAFEEEWPAISWKYVSVPDDKTANNEPGTYLVAKKKKKKKKKKKEKKNINW